MVVLGATGRTFCAGGDMNWMRSMAQYGEKENVEDATAHQAAMACVPVTVPSLCYSR